MDNLSVEQMVRDLLTQAIKDGLVAPNEKEWQDPDPQCRTSGELVPVANMLDRFLAIAASQPCLPADQE